MSLHKLIYKNLFIIKKTFIHLILFWGGFFFKNKTRGGSGNFEKGVERVNMVRYGILHDHTSKKTKIKSTPLYSTFKLKYRKNIKVTMFLMETSVINKLNVRNILNPKSKFHVISNST